MALDNHPPPTPPFVAPLGFKQFFLRHGVNRVDIFQLCELSWNVNMLFVADNYEGSNLVPPALRLNGIDALQPPGFQRMSDG